MEENCRLQITYGELVLENDIRIIIADSSSDFRSMLKESIDMEEKMTVVGETSNGLEVMSLIEEDPDIL